MPESGKQRPFTLADNHFMSSSSVTGPQIVLAYRDSYHVEHKREVCFATISSLCKTLTGGAPNGVFYYKYHIPEPIFEQFMSYVQAASNIAERQSLINIDNLLYFDTLSKELQCSILSEDCKTFISSSREINEIKSLLSQKRDHAIRELFANKFKHIITYSDIVDPQSTYQSSDWKDPLLETLLRGEFPHEFFADFVEMGQHKYGNDFYTVMMTQIDWSVMPLRINDAIQRVAKCGSECAEALGSLINTIRTSRNKHECVKLQEKIESQKRHAESELETLKCEINETIESFKQDAFQHIESVKKLTAENEESLKTLKHQFDEHKQESEEKFNHINDDCNEIRTHLNEFRDEVHSRLHSLESALMHELGILRASTKSSLRISFALHILVIIAVMLLGWYLGYSHLQFSK